MMSYLKLCVGINRVKMRHFFALCTCMAASLCATPTSLFWTNCTTDCVAQGRYHIDIDNYFSLGNRTKNGTSFAPDIGLVAGIPSFIPLSKELDFETGIDYLGGKSHPWLLNSKLSLKEGALFTKAPSLSIGIFNIGTTHSTNQSVVDAVIGTTLPKKLGRFFAGLYRGNRALGKHRSGFMVGYQNNICSKKDMAGREYTQWQFSADYASQKNAIGGGGFAITYHFSPDVTIETGPVWFNDTALNGRWKWSVQVGIDI